MMRDDRWLYGRQPWHLARGLREWAYVVGTFAVPALAVYALLRCAS